MNDKIILLPIILLISLISISGAFALNDTNIEDEVNGSNDINVETESIEENDLKKDNTVEVVEQRVTADEFLSEFGEGVVDSDTYGEYPKVIKYPNGVFMFTYEYDESDSNAVSASIMVNNTLTHFITADGTVYPMDRLSEFMDEDEFNEINNFVRFLNRTTDFAANNSDNISEINMTDNTVEENSDSNNDNPQNNVGSFADDKSQKYVGAEKLGENQSQMLSTGVPIAILVLALFLSVLGIFRKK